MQNNRFEKKVKAALYDLPMAPTQPVWEAVEKALQKKKKRRLFLLLFVVAGIGIGAGILFAVRRQNGAVNGTPMAKATIATKPAVRLQAKALPKQKERDAVGETGISAALTTTPKRTSINNNPVPGKQSSRKALASYSSQSEREQKSSEEKPGQQSATETVRNETIASAHESSNAIPVSTKPIYAENLDSGLRSSLATPKSTIDSTEIVQSAVIPTAPQDSTKLLPLPAQAGKDPLRKKIARVRWGVSLAMGASVRSAGAFRLGENKTADGRFTSFASPASGGFGIVAQPSAIRPAASFGIGASASMPIHPRHSLLLSLGYDLHSDYRQTGQRIDSSGNALTADLIAPVNVFYRSGTGAAESRYTNRFHYLNLSARWVYQPFRRLPLYTGLGIGVNTMLANNALSYDATQGLYYRYRNDWTRGNATLNAGLQYVLLRRSDFDLSAGPTVNWQLGSAHRVHKEQRPLFFGLELRLQKRR